MIKNCSTCKLWDEDLAYSEQQAKPESMKLRKGLCRRNAPDPKIKDKWPMTFVGPEKADWCGEWTAKLASRE